MKEYEKYRYKFSYREGLYRTISKEFNIKNGLYPGSHIDIAPSFFIPNMTYIDSFKGAIKFFQNKDEILSYVDLNKVYSETSSIVFYGEDYNNQLDIDGIELIISQYGGFVGQATKKYLIEGGILLANDSHGDATLAYLDPKFELIGVVTADGMISRNDLDKYFTFARTRPIDKEKVLSTMKGPKYKHQADNYLFRYKPKKDL